MGYTEGQKWGRVLRPGAVRKSHSGANLVVNGKAYSRSRAISEKALRLDQARCVGGASKTLPLWEVGK